MPEQWNGPIIDAHHHFWDPQLNDHPWLSPQANIAFRYGDYSAIKRRYMPEEYFADARDHNIVQTVYVETEWNPQDPIGETRFVEALAARYGVPNAIVAQAWLDHPDALAVLREQASFSAVRSVRHKPGGPDTPQQVGSCRTLMSDEHWRRGFAALQGLGLHFDLQTPWWNLPEAQLLAMSMTSKVKPYKFGFGPMAPEVYQYPYYAYCYRCPYGREYPSCDVECADKLNDFFVNHVAAEQTAAIIFEPVLGEGGFVAPPKDDRRVALLQASDIRGSLPSR